LAVIGIQIQPEANLTQFHMGLSLLMDPLQGNITIENA